MTECLIKTCSAPPIGGTISRLCIDHYDWANFELADPKYRTTEPPSPIGWKARERSAEALRLFP